MRVKVFSILCSVLLLASGLAFSALASEEVIKTQTVDFFALPVPDFSVVSHYPSGNLILPFTYAGIFPDSHVGTVVMPDYNGTPSARRWNFTGEESTVSLGDRTHITETYTLPQWDFMFSGVSVSITYVFRFVGSEQTGSPPSVRLVVGSTTYNPTAVNTTNQGNYYQWTLDINADSSTFRSLSFVTLYDYPVTKIDPVRITTGVYPMTVSTSYDYATAYSQATFDLIRNGISPSVDHISEKMDYTAAEMSRIADQQSAIHSEISVLPSKNQAAMSQALEDHDVAQYEFGKQEGKSQADDLISLVPTEKITQAGNAFGRLVDAMTTNKRTCYWEFPSMYIPQINGVTDERITLNKKFPIALHEWFDKLPVSVVTLVRAVCTCLLGSFFVRELMDLIAAIPKNGGSTDNG